MRLSKVEALVMTKLMWDYIADMSDSDLGMYNNIDHIKRSVIKYLHIDECFLKDSYYCALCNYVNNGAIRNSSFVDRCLGMCPLRKFWYQNIAVTLSKHYPCCNDGSPYILADEALYEKNFDYCRKQMKAIADECEYQLRFMK